MFTNRRCILAAALPMAISCNTALAQSTHAILHLPFEPRGQAAALNNAGAVTGFAGEYPVVYMDGQQGILPAPPNGDGRGTGHAMNRNGDIAGSYTLISRDGHAALWPRSGEPIDLGVLGGDRIRSSYANALNSSRQVVGLSTVDGGTWRHAFLWQDGEMADLDTLVGYEGWSEAFGINDAGLIVGRSSTEVANHNRAVLWENGRIVNLGTFGGRSSQANDINNHGQIVGWSHVSPSELAHAFFWENGEMHDIHNGSLAGETRATAITDNGMIVGYQTRFWEIDEPILWRDRWSTPVKVEDLLPPRHRWLLNYDFRYNEGGFVTDINERGMMCGWGTYDSRNNQSYIIVPVESGFTLHPPTPGIAGQVNEIRATGLSPGARVHFVGGRFGGGTIVPGCSLRDTALQIDDPQVAGTAVADADGVATLRVMVPQSFSGRPLLIQAIHRPACTVSNLVDQRFE